MLGESGPAKLIEALHALASAADGLFRTAVEPDRAAASIRAVEQALARVRSLLPGNQEVDGAAVWLVDARACLEMREEDGLRHAANRIYEAALLLIGSHLPPALTIMLVVRTMLRDVLGEAGSGDAMQSARRRLRHAHGLVARVRRSHREAGEPALAAVVERLTRAQVVLEGSEHGSGLAEAVSAPLAEVDRAITEMQGSTQLTSTRAGAKTSSRT